MEFKVSVIIPVYNGERFIKKAIASVSIFDEVTELIIIEDGSTDGTLNIVNEIARQNSKVKVYRHENGVNKGRSASRNLGIKKSTCPYIAFLDADDFYLPNRFDYDIKIFSEDENADGVYNAIGSHFYIESTEKERTRWKLLSLWERIAPEQLFDQLTPIGRKGYFSGDGLTVKRTVFEEIGYFNTNLEVAEDTELYLKMAAKCKLIAGQIEEPVALRGVHDNNVFKDNDSLYIKNRKIMYESLLEFCVKEKLSSKRKILVWKCLWKNRKSLQKSYVADLIYWLWLITKNPHLLAFKQTYKPLISK